MEMEKTTRYVDFKFEIQFENAGIPKLSGENTITIDRELNKEEIFAKVEEFVSELTGKHLASFPVIKSVESKAERTIEIIRTYGITDNIKISAAKH